MLGFLKQTNLWGDAFWALFGQFGSALALLIGTRLLTELVTPEVFGQVALLSGFVALGVSVFAYPFIFAGMRMISECIDQQQRAELLAVVSRLTARSTLIIILLLVLASAAYNYLTQQDTSLLLLAGILLAATVRRELGVQLLIGERRQRDASFWQTSDSILRPLLAIALVWSMGGKAEWLLLGYILASIISNLIWSLVNRLSLEQAPVCASSMTSRNVTQAVWRYALPLMPMELIFWVNGLGDRYVIGYLLTAAEVGLYAATYTIINEAFNRSAMVLLRTFQPAYFQSFSQQQTREGLSILWLWLACVVALGIIGVALVWLTKDWVASLLLAKSYHSAVELMPAIALGSALHAVGTVLAQPLLAKKRTRTLLKGRLCGALTAALCLPLMVQHFGLPGAAMANPIYYGVEALVLALLAKPWDRTTSRQASPRSRLDTSIAT